MSGLRIGNRISVGASGKKGVDWSSYWATLISATVENAAPTHVVLTFPAAQTSLTDTDFTITGFTIASGSWTGAVLTLVLSEAVSVWDSNLIITFVTTSGIATVTNNVADDGNTVAWYDTSDATTITDDGGGLISKLEDKLGSGHDLIAAGAARPTLASGNLTFNGSSNYMKTAAFAYAKPEFAYLLMRQLTLAAGKFIFEGNASGGGRFRLISAEAYNIYAGTSLNLMGTKANMWNIFRILLNGANSSGQRNIETAIAGNAGTNDMGGITIGAYADGSGGFGHFILKEAIFRKDSDDAAIYRHFEKKYCQSVLIIGDSNSNDAGEWPDKLAASWAGNRYPLIHNLAYIGTAIHNTDDNYVTHPWMEHQVSEATALHIDTILIMLGTNDAVLDAGMQAEYSDNLIQLQTEHPEATIYCISIPHKSVGQDETTRTANNPIMKAIAEGLGCTWWDNDTWLDRSTDYADTIHFNAGGHTKFAAEVLSRLDV